jgi:hypothetical protein
VIQVPSSCLKVRERAFLEFIRPAVIRVTEGREFPRAVVELLLNGRYGEAEALVPEVEEIKALRRLRYYFQVLEGDAILRPLRRTGSIGRDRAVGDWSSGGTDRVNCCAQRHPRAAFMALRPLAVGGSRDYNTSV